MIANGFLIWDAQSPAWEVALAAVLFVVVVLGVVGLVTRWIWGDWPF